MRADPPHAAAAEDDGLAEAFWSVARRLRHASRDVLEPWGLAPSHSRALVVLMRGGPMRLSELSDHLHIAPRSTTEVVDGLEERGLVARQPDPTDRRATLVDLTDEGRRVGDAIKQARAGEAEGFFARLSATDRDRLRRILRTLLDD